MFKASHTTAVVSSTNLKRHYQKVKSFLDQNMMVVLTNRNSEDHVDGILIPYSKEAIELLEDFLEEKTLDKELKKSFLSAKKKEVFSKRNDG